MAATTIAITPAANKSKLRKGLLACATHKKSMKSLGNAATQRWCARIRPRESIVVAHASCMVMEVCSVKMSRWGLHVYGWGGCGGRSDVGPYGGPNVQTIATSHGVPRQWLVGNDAQRCRDRDDDKLLSVRLNYLLEMSTWHRHSQCLLRALTMLRHQNLLVIFASVSGQSIFFLNIFKLKIHDSTESHVSLFHRLCVSLYCLYFILQYISNVSTFNWLTTFLKAFG